MDTATHHARGGEPWDEDHVKALLRFPRYPTRLIQQEPWRSWIDQHGGVRAIYAYLQSYPLSPSQSKLLEVVLSHPETLSDVCAERLHISRATYFYRLRDLLPTLAHALNQWKVEAAPAARPQPALEGVTSSALPSPLTPYLPVGGALAALIDLARRPEVHLVTITGPGGSGKTRLAVEAARALSGEFADGVCFVSLAALSDARAVEGAIAHALGLPEGAVRPGGQSLKAYLRARQSLLVLDTFEHVLPAAALLPELLAHAPRLKVLVTSRAVLHLYGEHVFAAPELPLPASTQQLSPAEIRRAPAIELFVQRAQAVNPHFELDEGSAATVAELCARLEGLPLAIELAAFQIKILSPRTMLSRASCRLNFLTHGPCDLPPRQQSLRNSLRWSYGLLSEEQAALFARLAVFVAGFRIEAAETVCCPPGEPGLDVIAGLMALVDQSLLHKRVEPDGEPRFVMRESSREYALEQLALRDELLAIQHAHALYFLDLIEGAGLERGPVVAADQLELVAREYGNLRAALVWAQAQGEDRLAQRFAAALGQYWRRRPDDSSERVLIEAVLAQTIAPP